MRGSRTLSLYVVREVVQYALLGLAAITVVLVMRNLVRVLDEVIGAGFRLADLVNVLQLLITMLVSYALPISFLFGVLLAIGRMATDVEIIAMRACGVGLAGILLPIVTVGILISGVSWYMAIDVEPAAQRGLAKAILKMLARGATIVPGQFTMVGGRLIYAEARDSGALQGVVIADRTDPKHTLLIFAETGQMTLDDDTGVLVLHLETGDIHVDPPSSAAESYQRIAFDKFDYTIDMGGMLGPGAIPRAREMTMEELRDVAGKIAAGQPTGFLRETEPIAYSLHLNRRLATPLSATLFALVGVPLAMRRTRGARAWGVLLSAGVAFLYYALQSVSEMVVMRGILVPVIALWIPNVLFALLAVFLLMRARRVGV